MDPDTPVPDDTQFTTGGPVTSGPALEPGPPPSATATETEQSDPEPEDATEAAVPPPGRYRFTYGDTTIYAAHGVIAHPGDVHDWPDGPPTDGRWTLATEGE